MSSLYHVFVVQVQSGPDSIWPTVKDQLLSEIGADAAILLQFLGMIA